MQNKDLLGFSFEKSRSQNVIQEHYIWILVDISGHWILVIPTPAPAWFCGGSAVPWLK